MNPIRRLVSNRRLRDAVEKMNQWEDVAGELRARQITGYKFVPTHCPIARYLSIETEAPISVGQSVASVLKSSKNYALASNVTEFIARFDSDDYPDMIRG